MIKPFNFKFNNIYWSHNIYWSESLTFLLHFQICFLYSAQLIFLCVTSLKKSLTHDFSQSIWLLLYPPYSENIFCCLFQIFKQPFLIICKGSTKKNAIPLKRQSRVSTGNELLTKNWFLKMSGITESNYFLLSSTGMIQRIPDLRLLRRNWMFVCYDNNMINLAYSIKSGKELVSECKAK